MDWHEAYLVQARSEHAILKRLADLNPRERADIQWQLSLDCFT